MGFSISWIAVRGKPKDAILAQLGLADTGEPDEANDSEISGAELPNSAYLLFLNDLDHPFLEEESLARLSVGCDVLSCQVEEHVMFSSAFMYTDGAKTWEVAHLAEEGMYHLEIGGKPPEVLETIHADMRAAQDEEGGESAEVDYIFDVPLLLAMSFVGYRHDQVALANGETPIFTALRRAA